MGLALQKPPFEVTQELRDWLKLALMGLATWAVAVVSLSGLVTV